MKIEIMSYIKEKVLVEILQCNQMILKIKLDEGERYISNIDLQEYGIVEIFINISNIDTEEKEGGLEKICKGIYYLLGASCIL